jgi:uncharacterized membrane protein YqjE
MSDVSRPPYPPASGNPEIRIPESGDPTQPLQPDKGLGELLGELTSEFSSLVRHEVALAKIEMTAEAKRAGKAGGLLGAGVVLGFLALLLVSFAAAWGLAEIMPAGLAFLIVGVIFGVVAAVLGLQGKKKIEEINPVPEQTVESVKEDVRWAKTQTS